MNNKIRTLLNITAVVISVMSVILLASLGSGLVSTGEEVFQKSSMHLWITGKPVDIQTRYSNPGEAKINNAHKLSSDVLKDHRINVSTPMLTEMIYVCKENEQPAAVFGLGVGTEGPMIAIMEGTNLHSSNHYNNGAYDNPWTKEVLADSRIVTLLDVGVGDMIYAGKTINNSIEHQFKVVGITNSLSSFSTAPMLIFPFSEFQELTGNHYYDSASMIIIRLNDPEDANAVKEDLEGQYPEYIISTNKDLLDKIIMENSMILASAVSIVLLAVFMGGALVINTILLSINEKRQQIGIMQVIGMSRWSIMKSMGSEGAIITCVGGLAGCLLSVPAVIMLNYVIESMIGFEEVLELNVRFMALGLIIALCLGLLSIVVALWRLEMMKPIHQLRSI